ncbi:MAG: TIGR02206 family membrane protein [Candidatus Marinimicrobia bacterium]|nr:TIGR02206 family membrane protein [Candidatus Neomarinimicrobiota bacterium]
MWKERLNQLSYENTIPMFGRDHLIYLIIILVVSTAFLIYAKRKFTGDRANKVGRILGIIAIVHLFLEIPTLRLILGMSLATSLPLHLCNLGMIMVGILLITRKQWALNLAYFWALCGASQSLLTPDLSYIFPHPLAITFFTAHTLEIVGVLYAVTVLKMRPQWSSIPKVMAITAGLAVIIFPINYIHPDANYMFLKFAPVGGSLIDLLGPWPWYILSLVGVAGVLFVIAYLPYAILDGIKARKVRNLNS